MVYHLRNRHKDWSITRLISLFMHRRPRTVFRGCKSQFKNAGFGQNKNVGFPTFLFCLFPTLLFYPLHGGKGRRDFDSPYQCINSQTVHIIRIAISKTVNYDI